MLGVSHSPPPSPHRALMLREPKGLGEAALGWRRSARPGSVGSDLASWPLASAGLSIAWQRCTKCILRGANATLPSGDCMASEAWLNQAPTRHVEEENPRLRARGQDDMRGCKRASQGCDGRRNRSSARSSALQAFQVAHQPGHSSHHTSFPSLSPHRCPSKSIRTFLPPDPPMYVRKAKTNLRGLVMFVDRDVSVSMPMGSYANAGGRDRCDRVDANMMLRGPGRRSGRSMRGRAWTHGERCKTTVSRSSACCPRSPSASRARTVPRPRDESVWHPNGGSD